MYIIIKYILKVLLDKKEVFYLKNTSNVVPDHFLDLTSMFQLYKSIILFTINKPTPKPSFHRSSR